MYLFLDTTSKLIIGIIDSSFKWKDYRIIETNKSSKELHPQINKILAVNDINLENIKGLFYISGPGSYTGMRVSEGFSQIAELKGLEIYSLNHGDLIKLLNLKETLFYMKAFKGEYFIHSLNEKSLIKSEVLEKFTSKYKAVLDIDSIQKCLFENISFVAKTVISNKMRSELFYFRALDKEFNVRGSNV